MIDRTKSSKHCRDDGGATECSHKFGKKPRQEIEIRRARDDGNELVRFFILLLLSVIFFNSLSLPIIACVCTPLTHFLCPLNCGCMKIK